jgi:hypothetical protein
MSPPQLVTLRKRRRMLAVRSSPSTWMLPILDRLASKPDAAADRTHGVLRVKAIHQHLPFSRATAAAVYQQIRALAD